MKSSSVISRELALQLPLRNRIAWGASVVQSALRDYSKYFHDTFRMEPALDYAWHFASGMSDDPERRRKLADAIGELCERGDSEGYSVQVILMPIHVLEEIEKRDGKAVHAAVEDAGYAFAAKQLFRQNLTTRDRTVPREYIQALEQTVAEFALRAFQYFQKLPEHQLCRENAYFEDLNSHVPVLVGLSFSEPQAEHPKPPIHEASPK
jgi:hypothetical protein